MKTKKLRFLLYLFTAIICTVQTYDQISVSSGEEQPPPESQVKTDSQSEKLTDDGLANKRRYLSRFSQSWKLYAKANDIAKREKLRKALLDALKSMNGKKKSTMTSLTHDTVNRIQHAAQMLKEFKKMYQLSEDVMNSFKEYNTARKNLVEIGKTNEGAKMLKRYVVLRNRISKNYKRNTINRPVIVDDTDVDGINELKAVRQVVKDIIGKQDILNGAEKGIGQRKVTPGTLQIIRFRKTKVNKAAPQEGADDKRFDILADARAAFTKAKEKINQLKEKIKEIATSRKDKSEAQYGRGSGSAKGSENGKGSENSTGGEKAAGGAKPAGSQNASGNKTETNDHGANKKSYLTTQADAVKEESLGHVNNEMSISGMLKKAEKDDLQAVGRKESASQLTVNAATSLPAEKQSALSSLPANQKAASSLPIGGQTTAASVPQGSQNMTASLPAGSQTAASSLPVGNQTTVASAPHESQNADISSLQGSQNAAVSRPVGNQNVASPLPAGSQKTVASVPQGTDVTSFPLGSQNVAQITPSTSQQQSSVPLQAVIGQKAEATQGSNLLGSTLSRSQPTTAVSNVTTTSPTTSLNSVMDSLAEGEDSLTRPTGGQPTKTVQASSAPTTAQNQYTAGQASPKTPDGQHSETVPNQSSKEQQNASIPITSPPTEAGNSKVMPIAAQQSAMKAVLASSQISEHKEIEVAKQDISNLEEILKSSLKANQSNEINNKTTAVPGVKKSMLNEALLQQKVVKVIDKQLETLQRLQDAKRARRKFESAKHELQNKVKKLYDMAVAYEVVDNDKGELNTKAFINPLPSSADQELHPGVALAGISDKAVTTVQTPSDDSEHHGFTLGGLDGATNSPTAHIVDIQPKAESSNVEKVYQVGVPTEAAKEDVASKKSNNEDKALKSLTEAINNDLKQIEDNEARKMKEKKQSVDLKKMMEPLLSKFLKKDNSDVAVKESAEVEKSQKVNNVEAPTERMPTKKSTENDGVQKETQQDVAVKAQDAFKEVEDYLSKALKHVAKEAITEDSKVTDEKEVGGVTNEETDDQGKTKSGSQTGDNGADGADKDKKPENKGSGENVNKGGDNNGDKVEDKNKNEKDNSAKDDQKDKDNQAKIGEKQGETSDAEKGKTDSKETTAGNEADRTAKLKKIVEDAMKEHIKDPTNPHPVNSELIKPTEKVKKEETKNVTVNIKTDEPKQEEQKPAAQKSDPTKKADSPTETAPQTQANSEAITKAEHLEEQVAQLQEKMYNQGAPTEAYKSIEQKPLFSQTEEETPAEQPQMYTDPVHHHKHHHHRHYEDYEDDDPRSEEDDDDDEDEDSDDRSYDNDDDDDEEEDDNDRKRKKSYMEPMSWPRYHSYQRDLVASHRVPRKEPEMMNRGMMNDADDGREELEDSKKSIVPKRRIDGRKSFSRWKNEDLMYTL